jgi:hypothetical protein
VAGEERRNFRPCRNCDWPLRKLILLGFFRRASPMRSIGPRPLKNPSHRPGFFTVGFDVGTPDRVRTYMEWVQAEDVHLMHDWPAVTSAL